jgi:hypothetical protein
LLDEGGFGIRRSGQGVGVVTSEPLLGREGAALTLVADVLHYLVVFSQIVKVFYGAPLGHRNDLPLLFGLYG